MRLETDEKISSLNNLSVRMPSKLREKIKEAAKQNKHSMNAEIVTRLEKSFSDDAIDPHQISTEGMAFMMKESIKRLVAEGIISVKDGMVYAKKD
jgi:hypothetical protein